MSRLVETLMARVGGRLLGASWTPPGMASANSDKVTWIDQYLFQSCHQI